MNADHPRMAWWSLSDETRVGLSGGVTISLLLAALVATYSDVALGLSVLQYGVRAGTVTDEALHSLTSGVVFLLPGFLCGLGSAIHHRLVTGTAPSKRARVVILALLTVFPVTLTMLLGFVGFAVVVATLFVDGGVGAALVMGVFLGGLLMGVALGGATVMVPFVAASAAVGLTVGHGLVAAADEYSARGD